MSRFYYPLFYFAAICMGMVSVPGASAKESSINDLEKRREEVAKLMIWENFLEQNLKWQDNEAFNNHVDKKRGREFTKCPQLSMLGREGVIAVAT